MLALKYEFKRLFSGTVYNISILVFLLSGLLAIHLGGESFNRIQQAQQQSIIAFDKQTAQLKLAPKLPEMGSIAYYATAPTTWQLNGWAALFKGQSQNNLTSMSVNALALQGQIYNKEFINPDKHRAGGFDLGFVLAYMLPLLIGVLSINLLSDEKQSGRWSLLSSFPGNAAQQMIIRLLGLRFALVSLLVIILFSYAAISLSLPIDYQFTTLLFLSILYCLFWFVVATIILSLNKGNLINTLLFISTWLVFAILIPGTIHLAMSEKFNHNAPLKASTQQRMVLNDGWDQDKHQALTEFSQLYPEFSEKLTFEGRFHWKWYYAMQHLSDLSVAHHWSAHTENIYSKERWLNKVSWLSPNLSFQRLLNKSANTNSLSHLEYLKQVESYHTEIREFIYPYLFNDTPVTVEDVDKFPRFEARQVTLTTTSMNYLPHGLFFLILIVLLTGWVKLRFKKLAVC
ncbi:DUF3526 domain-containing protein [Psychrobium sp. 1_MG-2023]|uniref:DUF3526 domain-containing protein n=1 Tax=Psychrobium sp. 1_MG-2023 TaxID=3062624 RepID=UPI000C31BA84|nr:DUF3526 domain-containing protein [Psychrobium sp. 1_MG-2023]MDP2561836.1 DUF3526 domain-containing protein [Psychrobium sp. 1_MG-2023]PKF55792.1 hypothetical protein CW748_11665 [Alteromonadales bacterium alter-6D02]